MRGQPGFFDFDDRLKLLSDLGDQLESFRSAVDFELFRLELNAALSYADRTEGGRPPFDPVLMFKILVIEATSNLSMAEFLIDDRLSFMRFLGLGLEDRVPDARTIVASLMRSKKLQDSFPHRNSLTSSPSDFEQNFPPEWLATPLASGHRS